MTVGSVMKNRIVILGFPRSGTTLLARLLDAHPEISCPPETYLFTAAARFLQEQDVVEGPAIGPLSGLELLGVPAEDTVAALRRMVFELQDRVSDGARVRIEKTAIDIFRLNEIETLLSGHARFLLLIRNPLDVIASNLDLAKVMGAWLDDLYRAMGEEPNQLIGLARAWIDRMTALEGFFQRHGDACYRLRYEDLTSDTLGSMAALYDWIGVAPKGKDLIENALNGTSRLGLGDFRFNEMDAIRPPDPKGWRKRLPPATAGRIVPMLAPLMEANGYNVPKLPRPPSREDAIRQFVMATQLKRLKSSNES